MRLKKHKRNRKVVRFYSTRYGFREPFKVLCDGTFLHHLVLNKLGSPQEVLSSLLSARTMLFTTRCIISELKRLGESFSESLKGALSLTITKCEHLDRVSASSCIEAIVKDKNSDHFFVASQDADLRKKFREIPGVPAIYAIRNSMFLDQPSACHLQFVKTAEEERLHMKELEADMIKEREKKRLADQAAADGTESLGDVRKGKGVRSMRTSWTFNQKDKSMFKRKRAKVSSLVACSSCLVLFLIHISLKQQLPFYPKFF
ncbi:rRNA-processing UTP23-like protein [Nymphaea thermarum]|nr:rRNA-processing UTP23-like protein [Nymphaea thermarum]